VTGPAAPQTFSLAEGTSTIGHGESCEVTIADRYVSRRHCQLEVNAVEAVLRDLGSTNGTLVNGIPVAEHLLRPGDRITLGTTELIFSRMEEPQAVTFVEDETMVVRPRPQPVEDWQSAEEVPPGTSQAASPTDARAVLDCYRLAHLIFTAPSLMELAGRLAEHVLGMVEADWGAFFVCDREGEFRLTTSREREGKPGTDMRFSRTVLREAVSKRTAVLSHEVTSDRRFSASESVAAGTFRSVLCVPLLTEERPLGAIYLASRSRSFAFSKEELAWLQAVSGQASVALERMLEHEKLVQENVELRRRIVLEHGLIGESPAMRTVFRFISRVAPTDAAVLIRGETGTGKELVSRAIHYNSMRKDGAFVCINCAALPRELIESELFGHERGAFTGAVNAKAGKFELAENGTIFLDEVGELDPAAQAKLLRVLEGQSFERVGGTKPITVDVRVLAATNRNLDEAVEEGTFRADLYHRLNVIATELPPLRDRGGDVGLLARFFLGLLSERVGRPLTGFSTEAMEVLGRYRWPGNVRELRNAVEHAVVLGHTDVIQPEDLPASVRGGSGPEPAGPADGQELVSLREAESRHVLSVYRECDGNKTRTAEVLDISRDTLYRKLKEYGIE
jgi:Nif-specific regulatory protein